jgi:two-component system sensor histidine kinase DegS
VIHDLRKSAVGHAGLVETLGLLLVHLRDESTVDIVSNLDASLRADASTELLVYQIAREALTNAIKHANPTTIWVSLRLEGRFIALSVIDDGSGFDPQGDRDDRHYGLALMHERAEMLGGDLRISSQPGRGTTISLNAPAKLG